MLAVDDRIEEVADMVSAIIAAESSRRTLEFLDR